MSESTSDFLTIADVAALLKVSPRTVHRAISKEAGKDRLLATRFLGSVRIRRGVLDQWLKARTA